MIRKFNGWIFQNEIDAIKKSKNSDWWEKSLYNDEDLFFTFPNFLEGNIPKNRGNKGDYGTNWPPKKIEIIIKIED